MESIFRNSVFVWNFHKNVFQQQNSLKNLSHNIFPNYPKKFHKNILILFINCFKTPKKENKFENVLSKNTPKKPCSFHKRIKNKNVIYNTNSSTTEKREFYF